MGHDGKRMEKEYIWMKDITRIDWIRARISFHDSILEVGCDTNDVWDDTPFTVTTMDINPEVEPDIVGDAHSLPFKNKAYDIVCLDEVLEHVTNPHTCLTEALRVARKKVIATVPWEHVWDKKYKPFEHPDHMRYYEPQTFQDLLDSLKRLYQIDILRYEGLVWIGGEIIVPKSR